MPEKDSHNFREGLTFDDILLVPSFSQIMPSEVDVSTWLTPSIKLHIPILSAAMDTVTESKTAICLAQEGGIGIIHRNMGVTEQAQEVEKVKKSESGMIVDPITISPEQKIKHTLDLMAKYRISGIPVTKGKKLVGIITNRDLRFETNLEEKVKNVMTKENLITVKEGINLEDSKKILHKHRIEKLLVVDRDFNLRGLITIKDIEKMKKYPYLPRTSWAGSAWAPQSVFPPTGTRESKRSSGRVATLSSLIRRTDTQKTSLSPYGN